MTALRDKKCLPCEGEAEPLIGEEAQQLMQELKGWTNVEDHHLEKNYTFKDFKEALAFVNQVGEVAEELGHHPNIAFTWGRVGVSIWTHRIDGLSENDFILAANIDALK